MDDIEKSKKGFQKGVSGNPEGRKKGQKNYSTMFKEIAKKIPWNSPDKQNNFEMVVEKCFDMARDGNTKCIDLILHMCLPKDFSMKNGEKVQINIIYPEKKEVEIREVNNEN